MKLIRILKPLSLIAPFIFISIITSCSTISSTTQEIIYKKPENIVFKPIFSFNDCWVNEKFIVPTKDKIQGTFQEKIVMTLIDKDDNDTFKFFDKKSILSGKTVNYVYTLMKNGTTWTEDTPWASPYVNSIDINYSTDLVFKYKNLNSFSELSPYLKIIPFDPQDCYLPQPDGSKKNVPMDQAFKIVYQRKYSSDDNVVYRLESPIYSWWK